MLIKAITVENFLPFRGSQRVVFSTDPEQNVTLIMGDNGAGKTSLAQAFEWCLYGRAPKDSVQVINAYVRDHLSPGSFSYALVEINLEKDGIDYSVSRKQKYSRGQNGGGVKAEPQEFNITFREDGETKAVALSDQKSTISKLLSSELSHYFFFDGEHVKNMRNEIEAGKSSDFAEAVKSILGLKPIDSALSHLKAPGNRKSVERSLKGQYDAAGNADLQSKLDEIKRLEGRIEKRKEEQEDARADKEAAKQSVKKWEELIAENAASEEAAKAVEKARSLVTAANSQYAKKLDSLFRTFRSGQYRLFTAKPITDARAELADEDKISKGVPSVNDKTLTFLLERGECLCGTKFKTGDDVWQHLSDLMKYVPPKDLGTYISEFDKECRVRSEAPLSLPADMVAAYQELAEARNAVESAEKALSAAIEFLNGINQVDVKILRANLRSAEKDRDDAGGREYNAGRDITAWSERIRTLEGEVKAYGAKNAKNQMVTQCLNYVDFIYRYLEEFYSSKEAETRKHLESVVNKYFTTMYDGELHLTLDENYGVTVIVDDIDTTNDVWKTSSGQTLAIILAFISGILDIARDNIKSGNELLQGDTYPLVMDAPLSDFDKTRIGTICSVLPTVAEQVIIIIKDTDGDLAEQHLSARIGKRYSIAKLKDYESVIKE